MARSSSLQPKSEPDNGATCSVCGAYLRRNTDLPRHMLIHAKNKESLMFTCPMDGCGHQTLQKSNLATHIRTHTRAKPHKCPESFPDGQKCDFTTADPSSLHRHRKRKHGYRPRNKIAPSGPYVPRASGSRLRGQSVESSAASSCESEESFGLRPEVNANGGKESQDPPPRVDNISAERHDPPDIDIDHDPPRIVNISDERHDLPSIVSDERRGVENISDERHDPPRIEHHHPPNTISDEHPQPGP
ncbi:hypothetical protein B0H10DRAFT_2208004 [Mycena sp. CBHHK59/15]|nr:hypothetical protein B0H10DRAFT_2208004 [Mycena sp. CBHHK59/15]